ncbi:MAG: threonylcarbamoyl-AMP synthase [Candidatus Lokiarchaeota archaeon]|nr:threonylcarbamoyl-AMP synthase [Candidatus Lokiarchaeota archaeon]
MGHFIIHLKDSTDPTIYIRRAAEIVMEGGIIAYPTDTVYGMGADPRNFNAVQKIFAIKLRDSSQGVPILVPDLEDALRIGVFRRFEQELCKHYWPGPLTIIVPLNTSSDITLNRLVTGGSSNIAIRIPRNPIILGICKILKELCGFGGIIGTSANYSGQPSLISGKQVVEEFSHILDFIIEMGFCKEKIPSTIIQFGHEDKNLVEALSILREGKISRQELLSVLGTLGGLHEHF